MNDLFLLIKAQMRRIETYFLKIFAELAHKAGKPSRPMIDATHPKAHGTAASLLKGSVPRRIGRTTGGLNSKLHAACDGQGRPLITLLSEGQVSDYKGATLMLDALPSARLAQRQGRCAHTFISAICISASQQPSSFGSDQ